MHSHNRKEDSAEVHLEQISTLTGRELNEIKWKAHQSGRKAKGCRCRCWCQNSASCCLNKGGHSMGYRHTNRMSLNRWPRETEMETRLADWLSEKWGESAGASCWELIKTNTNLMVLKAEIAWQVSAMVSTQAAAAAHRYSYGLSDTEASGGCEG